MTPPVSTFASVTAVHAVYDSQALFKAARSLHSLTLHGLLERCSLWRRDSLAFECQCRQLARTKPAIRLICPLRLETEADGFALCLEAPEDWAPINTCKRSRLATDDTLIADLRQWQQVLL